ncbi:MAG: hypothetical protein ACRD9R_20155, partial [Pyrinomonadaceae bacterium]
DLGRAAGELRLGLRQGERKFILRALLGQDARGMLGWLEGEAGGWVERHRRCETALAGAAGEWGRRAGATARLLAELKLFVPEGAGDPTPAQ